MAGNIGMIRDPAIKIQPGEMLAHYLKKKKSALNDSHIGELPENIKNFSLKKTLLTATDVDWLNQFLINERSSKENLLTGEKLDQEIEKIMKKDYSNLDLKEVLTEKHKKLPYLHNLLRESILVLPENEIIERNPDLAKRIEKLKKEQEEREYKAMTKNVDMTVKHIPEDSLSYQMNMMNRHLIAVGQFLVSVGAGFAFGFLGIELIIGDIKFGVRLLLGILCALIIAVAEFYFLAKHLNEEEKKEAEKPADKPKSIAKKVSKKIHQD